MRHDDCPRCYPDRRGTLRRRDLDGGGYAVRCRTCGYRSHALRVVPFDDPPTALRGSMHARMLADALEDPCEPEGGDD